MNPPLIKLKIFIIAGTRPEFIKVYPIYQEFLKRSQIDSSPGTQVRHQLEVRWVASGQHQELLEDLYSFFQIKPDYEFDLSNINEDSETHLSKLAAKILEEASMLYAREKPDLVIVQGDTLTSQQCALAAFYQKIEIAHIEAGIRTNDISSPFPEELSRRIISQISTLNFAPSQTALTNLEAEKVMNKKKSFNFYTGNTVVDMLEHTRQIILAENFVWGEYRFARLAFHPDLEYDMIMTLEKIKHKKIILVTAHRRENEGEAHENLANAILRIAERYASSDSIEFIVSVHKNPQARIAFESLEKQLQERSITNVRFLDAINYPLFLRIMMQCHFIVTDSGGVQEEAPYFGKPVLVFRDLTERVEGIEHGMARLIGTEEHVVHGAMLELLTDQNAYNAMIVEGMQPYGDGLAASRITDVSLLYLKGS